MKNQAPLASVGLCVLPTACAAPAYASCAENVDAPRDPMRLEKACSAEDGPRDAPDDDATGQATAADAIDEAVDAVTAAGDACRAACSVSYATACWRVMQLCELAEVITIGGATVACATAIPATCLTGAALSAVCSGRCPA
jgi:hypothetical protein